MKEKNFAVPRHAVGGLLENQYPVFCGGSNVGWDDANGYEQGCYKMGDSVSFQVFFWQNFISQLSPEIFDPRKMYTNFLEVSFDVLDFQQLR